MENLGPLKILAFSGGDWVIYLLLACSVLTVAVIIERWRLHARETQFAKMLDDKAGPALEKGDLEAAQKAADGTPGAAAKVLSLALHHRGAGGAAVEDFAAAARLREKKRLEQRLLILGTLGNNAPFIGLFGTVLGVIKAFHDLSQVAAGPEVVMQGLSEALVATAVGLLVAMPAVIFYNHFMKRASDILEGADVMVRLVVAGLKDRRRS